MSEKPSILIVDDDPDFRLTTKLVLEGAGYEVLTAIDSNEAETAAAEHRPDLILLDVIMEEVDAGFVFAERYGKTYPIVLLSSIANSSVKIFDIHELPVRGILQKPIQPDALLETVKNAIAASTEKKEEQS